MTGGGSEFFVLGEGPERGIRLVCGRRDDERRSRIGGAKGQLIERPGRGEIEIIQVHELLLLLVVVVLLSWRERTGVVFLRFAHFSGEERFGLSGFAGREEEENRGMVR